MTPYLLIPTQGPTKRVAVPKSVGAVKHVGEDVKAAVWVHGEALCGNHISSAPTSVDGNLTHWLIFTQLSTSTSMYGNPVAFPKARNGPRSGSLGSNQCLWCATSRNGSAFGKPIGITRPPAQEGQTGIRGHCCMSPARREAVFWEADAAIGVATAETAAPDATSRRVKVPGLISGNESQFFCERAAVFAATATSKMRRGILLCGSQLWDYRRRKTGLVTVQAYH